jgi:putative (di)nucleoside polyphosphate hydrolase
MTAVPGEPRVMTPEQAARLPYRRGVGIMLLNREGKVFVAQRLDTPGEAWQMPQGGIDEGETPREAALRELREEVGTSRVQVLAESPDWVRYDLPVDLVPRTWCGRYRGQEQKWFVVRFLGTDDDIDINAETPEFSAWRWVDIRDLPDLIVPFKRGVYRTLVEAFGHLAGPADGA